MPNAHASGYLATAAYSFLYSLHFRSEGVNYRIAYVIDGQKNFIIVHMAGTRENFYDRLRRLFRR